MTDKQNDRSMTNHLVRGSAWMIAARWAMRLIGLVSTIILARLLTPDDFGVIALAMIVVGLLDTVAYAGVDLALMRPGNDSREHFDTAWTVQIIQGTLLAAALILAAPFAAPFFSEPRVMAVIQVIALRPFILGFQNIGIVAFRKELDFAKDFRFTLFAKLLNFFIIVSAALVLKNYWALVAGMASSAIIEVGLSYLMHAYRPKLSLKRIHDIWGFSQWLIISRIGSFLSRKTDEFVIGRVLGTTAMGGYHVASELATMPNLELVMPLRRAMFPTLSKAAKDPAEFEHLFLLSFSAVATLGFSIGFGLMAITPELVPILLGHQWQAAVAPMRWLALFGSFSALILALEMLLWVSGKTRISAIQTWLELIALIPVIYIAVDHAGIEGAALARLGVSISMVPIMISFASRSCHIGQLSFYKALWRPLLSSLFMAIGLQLLSEHLGASNLLLLLVKVASGLFLFPSTLLGLWYLSGRPRGMEDKAFQLLKLKLRSIKAE